jgi:hypothetical protein
VDGNRSQDSGKNLSNVLMSAYSPNPVFPPRQPLNKPLSSFVGLTSLDWDFFYLGVRFETLTTLPLTIQIPSFSFINRPPTFWVFFLTFSSTFKNFIKENHFSYLLKQIGDLS